MFEHKQSNQKELYDYRKKDLDEIKVQLEKEENVRKERERQRSIARRQMKNGSGNQVEKMGYARRSN